MVVGLVAHNWLPSPIVGALSFDTHVRLVAHNCLPLAIVGR